MKLNHLEIFLNSFLLKGLGVSPLTARRIGARPGSLPGVSRAHSTEPIPVSFFIFFCCTAVLCEPCALSKEAEISSVLTFQSSRRKGQKPVTREKMLHHLSFELASSPSLERISTTLSWCSTNPHPYPHEIVFKSKKS